MNKSRRKSQINQRFQDRKPEEKREKGRNGKGLGKWGECRTTFFNYIEAWYFLKKKSEVNLNLGKRGEGKSR
jgi:hypothetical protein